MNEDQTRQARDQIAIGIDILTAWLEYQEDTPVGGSLLGDRLNAHTDSPADTKDLLLGLVQVAAYFLMDDAHAREQRPEMLLQTLGMRMASGD